MTQPEVDSNNLSQPSNPTNKESDNEDETEKQPTPPNRHPPPSRTNKPPPIPTDSAPPSSFQTNSFLPPPTAPKANLRNTGVYKDYLLGLDNVKGIVDELCTDMNKFLSVDYYKTSTNDESEFNTSSNKVNDSFIKCNAELSKQDESMVLVDGQVPIATLINKLKGLPGSPNSDLTGMLTDYWERFKFTVESFQVICDKFEHKVLNRMINSCLSTDFLSLSSSWSESGADSIQYSVLPQEYQDEVGGYKVEMEEILGNLRLLAASTGTHINSSYLSSSSMMHRILKGCDLEQYPILKVIPDITSKMESLFRLAKVWIDRDEKYLYDIGQQIRKTKSDTRDKEVEMEKERERQRELMRSVKSAFLMCQNSKKRLKEIAANLHSLEDQVKESSRQNIVLTNEKHQKESMADFLQLSVTQTRKNYNLQLKRQKLIRQVKELEVNLAGIQDHIAQLKAEVAASAEEKRRAEERHMASQVNFNEMRRDLDTYSAKIRQLYSQLGNLRSTLTHLEGLQMMKISEERVEEFYDEAQNPANVKISVSLREKILEKKRLKMASTNRTIDQS